MEPLAEYVDGLPNLCGQEPVGAGNPVTLGDLGILADQTAESGPADDPDVCA